MVKQGDIIVVDFDQSVGHEQRKKRPVVVISNNDYYRFTAGLAVVVPISSTIRDHFPLHVDLDERTHTVGQIQCEQIKTIDCIARKYEVIERLPSDLFFQVQSIVKSFY